MHHKLFNLKDDEVLSIRPNFQDSEYIEPPYDTCCGCGYDSDPEIEIEFEFARHDKRIYFRQLYDDNSSCRYSITVLIDYLFTHLEEFESQTVDEFFHNISVYLDEKFELDE